jgi:hypothetical protein
MNLKTMFSKIMRSFLTCRRKLIVSGSVFQMGDTRNVCRIGSGSMCKTSTFKTKKKVEVAIKNQIGLRVGGGWN